MTAAPTHRSRPSAAGLLAACTTPLVLVVLCGLIVAEAYELQRLWALDEMREALDRTALGAARVLEERLTERPSGLLGDAALVGQWLTGLDRRPAEELGALYDTIEPLAREPFDRSELDRAVASFSSYRTLIERRSSDVLRKRSEELIAGLLADISRIVDERALRAKEREDLEKSQQASIERHALIANDFADFFGLPSAYEPTSPAGGAPRLLAYSSGVLSGLPKLSGLPDGLKDLSTLKATLDRLRAKVRAEGPQASRIFADKMSELHQASDAIVSAYGAASERLAGLAKTEQQSEQDLQAKRSYARSVATELMHQLVKAL